MGDVIKIVERKLKHAKRNLEYYDVRYGNTNIHPLTYHAGWNVGYWNGKVSAYEDLLDELKGE